MSKSIKELNLDDDFLFAKVMSNTEICRKVLEQILKVPILKVEVPTAQKTIDILYESKGVRLDVYVNDEKGTIYNVEMQRGKKTDLPKRVRYYQGSIDLDTIQPGNSYSALNKTYIIFICTFDPFSEGRHIYTFENRCIENLSLALGDETTKIFLNTRGILDDVDGKMLEFLAYIENTTDAFANQADNPLIREIQSQVNRVKESKEMEVEYMTLMMRDMEMKEEGRLEGRQEGRQEGRLETMSMVKLHIQGKSCSEIAAALNLPLDYVASVINDFEN